MKISEQTFDVLKNFSMINPSISVKAGNVLRSVSEAKNILAKAIIPDSFPKDFAIYELNQFLGLASLFEEGEYDFEDDDKAVFIKQGKHASRYQFVDSSMVTAAPEKELDLPTAEVTFKLDWSDLKKIINAANQLELPEIVVRGAKGKVTLVATDSKNPASNEFTQDLDIATDAKYQFIFKVENFKFMEQDYKVTISSKGISHFKGEVAEYWVATESGSKYDG